jgi:hypothetical protein
MLKALVIFACYAALAIPASADPITLTYSTSGMAPLAFRADEFLLTAQNGFLSSGAVTAANINAAAFYTGDSGDFSGFEPVVLSYNLTLDGVTHGVTQLATWKITPALDTFTVSASSPVYFGTAAGTWDVTMGGYSFDGTPSDIGSTQTKPLLAEMAVPEPATAALLICALLIFSGLWKRRIQDRT